MNHTAIRTQGLGKKYKIGKRAPYYSLREVISQKVSGALKRTESKISGKNLVKDYIWAIKDVEFEVKRGEVLGIIGPNGAGKSTLLKVLSRITDPTEGRAEIFGRVGSLLEIGTGFHPELTGRENIYLNGSILGMKKSEIRKKFDQIVDFAGVGDFIDTPVKHYSSGMHVRLAFSVAAHLETEILLVDEVLAVGDAAFQFKCLTKMSELSESDRTILFISHNMDAIRKLCSRSILLDYGKMTKVGPTQEVIDFYLASVRKQASLTSGTVSLREHPGRLRDHFGPVRLISVQVFQNGEATWKVSCGGEIQVVIGYETIGSSSAAQNTMFNVVFSNAYNQRLATCRSVDASSESFKVKGQGTVTCLIARLPLRPGLYKISVGCNTEAGHSDGIYDAATMEVVGTHFYSSGQVPPVGFGDMLIDHSWELKK